MPERNRVQALFPFGSRIIPNPAGTAPGIDLEVPRAGRAPARIFALPGVPAEMVEMWQVTVEPAIRATVGAPRVIRHRRVKCFGVGESELEAKLPELIRRGRIPSVGITVHGATITLRITAEGESADACCAAMAPTIATIHECLGDLVFGEEDDELQHAVVRLLHEKRKTLATAEWGSGGMIAHWLSEVADSADCFRGGMVLRNIAAVHNLIEPAGRAAVSESRPDEVGFMKLLVEQMAGACRAVFSADYGLAVGELPAVGPIATTPAKLWFAVASDAGTTAVSAPYAGHPDILKARGGKQALNLLRLTMLRS
jgi:nicotinamide-nucleotide amidase